MGIQSLELRNGVSFLKHFIIGHLEHLGFFSSSSGRSNCKSHLIQLCYSSSLINSRSKLLAQMTFLNRHATDLFFFFAKNMSIQRSSLCGYFNGFFYKSPGSGENLLPKPAHLCNSASYLVLCCYWYYCHAKLLLCSHYTHYAPRMMDSQAGSAKSLLAPFNLESCSNIFTRCTALNLS